MKARSRASRQRHTEQQADVMAASDPSLDVTMRELQTVLDEELSGLPEKYRSPLVLCYLEGKTNLQAARELGWPEGSISRRLSRGLELLRSRLTRRGLTLSALLLALLLSQESAAAAVPARLVSATARAAALVTAGEAVATAASATVADLVEEALQTTSAWAYRLGGAVLALLLLVGGVWTWTHTLAAAPAAVESRASGAISACGLVLPAGETGDPTNQGVAAEAGQASSGCPASACSAGR
jgi:hypothetical protein